MPPEMQTAVPLPEPGEFNVPQMDETGNPINSAAPANEGDIDWAAESEGLTVEGDLVVPNDAVPPEPVAATPAPAAPATPAPTPVATPAPIVTSEAQPVVPTPVPAPVAPPAPVAAPAPEPVAMPQIDLAKWEAEQIRNLEQFYAVNEEDAQKLQTEPELILPKLAANMHMQLTKSILASVQSLIPQMVPPIIQQHSLQETAEREARSAFYSVHPDLDKPEFHQAVIQVGQMYRAANKTADRNTAIKAIGDMTRLALGLAAPAPAPTANPAPAPSPAVVRPFTPSGHGGGPAPIQKPNMWSELLELD